MKILLFEEREHSFHVQLSWSHPLGLTYCISAKIWSPLRGLPVRAEMCKSSSKCFPQYFLVHPIWLRLHSAELIMWRMPDSRGLEREHRRESSWSFENDFQFRKFPKAFCSSEKLLRSFLLWIIIIINNRLQKNDYLNYLTIKTEFPRHSPEQRKFQNIGKSI